MTSSWSSRASSSRITFSASFPSTETVVLWGLVRLCRLYDHSFVRLKLLPHRVKISGGGVDHVGIVLQDYVLSASLNGESEDIVFRKIPFLNHNDAFLLEHPRTEPISPEFPAVARENKPDLSGGPVAVVGGRLDQYGGTSGPTTFVGELLNLGPVAKLPVPLFMARFMLSKATLAARAFSMAS